MCTLRQYSRSVLPRDGINIFTTFMAWNTLSTFSGTYYTLCQQSCWWPSSNARYAALVLSLIYLSLIFILLLMWFIEQKTYEEPNLSHNTTAVRWWFLQYHKVMCVRNKLAIIIIITPHHHGIVLYKISHFKDHDHPQGYKKRFSRKRYCLLPLSRCKNISFCNWKVWMIMLQKVKYLPYLTN